MTVIPLVFLLLVHFLELLVLLISLCCWLPPTLVYKHNAPLKFGRYYGNILYQSYDDIVINNKSNCILEHVNLRTIVESVSHAIQLNKTITGIIIYTESQHSNKIILTPGKSPANNIRRLYGGWRFNNFRDLLEDKSLQVINSTTEEYLQFETIANPTTLWYNKNLFINDFFVIRLIVDNVDQDLVKVVDVEPYVKNVNR